MLFNVICNITIIICRIPGASQFGINIHKYLTDNKSEFYDCIFCQCPVMCLVHEKYFIQTSVEIKEYDKCYAWDNNSNSDFS